ncbi:MAG TPA: hypothetical protein PKE45_02595, partial [Caldilineaceae bacterium]|nr:hypothetical protein [Caldilineaceae bacterium]
LCQLDRSYLRALSAYQKVVTQRNSLLRALCDQEARPNAESTDAQLSFWDDQLVQYGSQVIARRQQFIAQLQLVASQRHSELSEGREALQLHYLPSFNPGTLSDFDFARLKEPRTADWPQTPTAVEPTTVAEH